MEQLGFLSEIFLRLSQRQWYSLCFRQDPLEGSLSTQSEGFLLAGPAQQRIDIGNPSKNVDVTVFSLEPVSYVTR